MQMKWLIQMAWRDSRKNRGRLLLFMSSIVLGIAALVAINSFGENLNDQINEEAKSLLSADMEVESRQPFSKELLAFFDSLNVETGREINFGSMVLFPKSGGTRLVNIRAVDNHFPFYGKLITEPQNSSGNFTTSQKALVDKTLMLQFNATPGDEIKIGELTFTIDARVMKVPGQSGITSSVAPPVFIPVQYMDATNLIQRGSRINYSLYIKYPPGFDESIVEKVIKPRLEKDELRFEDVAERKKQVGNAYSDLTGFLNLTAFVALLLGCIGVASSVLIYIKEKIRSVAILRCMGASGKQSMGIFLVQVFFMGLLGSVIGALLGAVIQYFLPAVFSEFLPFNVTVHISWSAVLTGVMTGVVSSMLFALIPLLKIRNISPLKALRVSFERTVNDRWPLLLYVLVILFVIVFSYLQLGRWKNAIMFSSAIFIAFGMLTAFAKLIIWMVRKFFPSNSNFIFRQGLSNLYRPNNQTLILVVTIGLGTILITTLIMSQQLLLDKLNFSSAATSRPNMVVFDIQDKDLAGIEQVTRQNNMPVLGSVPIVSMRLHAINDRTVEELKKDSVDGVRSWVLDREYRVTYRDSLIDSEKLESGTWIGKVDDRSDSIFISLSSNFSDDMKVKLGDAVTFNVQGALIKTYIGSIRKIDFQRVQPNFLVLFPKGVLESAPKFHVLLTRFDSPEQSAGFQTKLVSLFPNVSIIDLNLILQTVDDVLKKVSFIIRFMALFSIVTGILVLLGSVIISKFQRIRESVILRTLGAGRKQILGINAIEYFLLGSLASLTGIFISVGLNMALAQYSFNTILAPEIVPLLICYASITITTVVLGLLNSREVVNKPPLEILRNED